MKNKIFALSDIHGCYDEMMGLYKQLPIDPEVDQLVICGDVIDRGPDTKKVIQQLIDWKELYPHWQFLSGNHEDLMLDALMYGGRTYNSYDLWFTQGGKQTFESYVPDDLSDYEKQLIEVKDAILQEHLEFLAALPTYYESEDYYFVHGGLIPGEKPEDSSRYDMIWVREGFIESDYDWGKKVIFGHTADGRGKYYNPDNAWGKQQAFMPIVMKNKIGIDTAVCPPANQRLTCIQLPEEIFYFERSHDPMGFTTTFELS